MIVDILGSAVGVMRYIWIYLDIYIYLEIVGYIWIYLDIFGDSWIYLEIVGYIWIYLDIFGYICYNGITRVITSNNLHKMSF